MPRANSASIMGVAIILILAVAVVLFVALRPASILQPETPIVTLEPSDTVDVFNPIVYYEAATPPTVIAYESSEDWATLTSPLGAKFTIASPKIIPWKMDQQQGDHTMFMADIYSENITGLLFMALVPTSEPSARDGYWGDIASLVNAATTCQALENHPEAESWRLNWVEDCNTFTNANGQLVVHLSGDWTGFRDFPAWINVYVMPSSRDDLRAAVLSDERFMDEQAIEYFATQGDYDVSWLRNTVRTMAETFSFSE